MEGERETNMDCKYNRMKGMNMNGNTHTHKNIVESTIIK
jgi:hypothetical protein